MKVLLDHNIPAKMRTILAAKAFTEREMGWDRLRNGELLKVAELHALPTADQSIFYQQNNAHRTLALIVLTMNDWEILRRHIDPIDKALERSNAGIFELLRLSRSASGTAEVE